MALVFGPVLSCLTCSTTTKTGMNTIAMEATIHVRALSLRTHNKPYDINVNQSVAIKHTYDDAKTYVCGSTDALNSP